MLDLSVVAACLVLGAEPELIGAVIETESGWNQTAFNVNGWSGDKYKTDDVAEAAVTAGVFIKNGYSVDIGIMQINSVNIETFEYSLIESFDVCTNVRMGEDILLAGIDRAVQKGYGGDEAIKVGLSYYNTGHPERGFSNGYVEKVWQRYRRDIDSPARRSDTEISWNSTVDLFDYSDSTVLDFSRDGVTEDARQ